VKKINRHVSDMTDCSERLRTLTLTLRLGCGREVDANEWRGTGTCDVVDKPDNAGKPGSFVFTVEGPLTCIFKSTCPAWLERSVEAEPAAVDCEAREERVVVTTAGIADGVMTVAGIVVVVVDVVLAAVDAAVVMCGGEALIPVDAAVVLVVVAVADRASVEDAVDGVAVVNTAAVAAVAAGVEGIVDKAVVVIVAVADVADVEGVVDEATVVVVAVANDDVAVFAADVADVVVAVATFEVVVVVAEDEDNVEGTMPTGPSLDRCGEVRSSSSFGRLAIFASASVLCVARTVRDLFRG
jgi:hypothetical protein